MTRGAARGSAVERQQTAQYGRDFRLWAAGQAVSVAGDRIATITLVFLVIRLSRSFAPALALFYIVRVVPTLVAGLMVGVVVDHFDRRRLMIGCSLGQAAILILVPTLSQLNLWTLYPMVLVLYALTLVFGTAARAALPDVVPAERMLGANAILSMISTGADAMYAVGGILVYALAFRTPFYIDAATFVFAAAMIWVMHIPHRVPGPFPDMSETLTRIGAGIRFIFDHPFLKWSTLAFTLAPVAGGAGFVLAPIYASRVLSTSPGLVGPLHSAVFRFSVLEVALGAGAFLGGPITSRLGRVWTRGRMFGTGIAASGIADGCLGLTGNLYVAAGILAVSGMFTTMFFVSGGTLLQVLTPTEIRGRVVAARVTIVQTALAAGSGLGGLALLALPVRSLWIAEGALLVAASLFVWTRPEVRDQP